MALTDKLTAIGNAVREKAGTTEPMTLDQMATAIAGLSIGGDSGDSPTDEELTYTGNCSRLFSGAGRWNWLFKKYGNRIKLNPGQSDYMFAGSTIEHIPDVNLGTGNTNYEAYYDRYTTTGVFQGSDCKSIGTISSSGTLKGLQNLFYSCWYLRECPKFADNFNFNWLQNGEQDLFGSIYESNLSEMFGSNYSLRSIPSELLRKLYNQSSQYQSYWIYRGFYNFYTIDELVGLPLPHSTSQDYTENLFGSYNVGSSLRSSSFYYCERVKDVIFDTQDDGTPYVLNMSNQSIWLARNVGYAFRKDDILNYNSGITADKEVIDQESYNRLKNDPDWFSCNVDYSRYNHDSAVRTINSLPDTSAFLASNGGTNTITFTGQSGALTDGGAINTLTEEEIIVATSKGWTVAFQ